jgi:uncharacterized membrane-anchored protein YitT (DUF2179 family)
MAPFDTRRITLSVPWNLFLLTVGGALFAFGLNAFAVPHGFISGGLFGSAMLLFYKTNFLTLAFWYAIVSLPVLLLGWFSLSHRFFFYSMYGMVATTVAAQFITCVVPLEDSILAAIAAGSICGVGLAVMLRSLGSDGGLTIVAMVLHQKYNIKVGGFNLMFNIVLFFIASFSMPIDKILYSVVMVYVYSGILDYSMEIVNQRKAVMIISETAERIAAEIMDRLHKGVTYLYAKGAYTNKERHVILTVVQNYQLKRLEELVYTIDDSAFLIIENTYNVIGRGFSERKRY